MEIDLLYDIALSFDESLTPFEKKLLLNTYGSSKEILGLKKSFLKNILGRRWTGSRFESDTFIKRAEKVITFVDKIGIKTLRFDETGFPSGLKEIPDHPFLIYYRGNIDYCYEKSIAIVGTKKSMR